MAQAPLTQTPLLEVRNLSVSFRQGGADHLAVDRVSFSLAKGRTLALVGESGSGKSVTSLSVIRLIPNPPGRIASGSIHFHEDDGSITDLLALPEERMRKYRGNRISMIFQEPMASFAPAITVGKQMVEQLQVHTTMSKSQAKELSVEMLDRVGITDPHRRFDQYVFEYSGGMRQRAMIAMALIKWNISARIDCPM